MVAYMGDLVAKVSAAAAAYNIILKTLETKRPANIGFHGLFEVVKSRAQSHAETLLSFNGRWMKPEGLEDEEDDEEEEQKREIEKVRGELGEDPTVLRAVEAALAMDLRLHMAVLKKREQVEAAADWEGKENLDNFEACLMKEIKAWNGLRTRIIYAGPGAAAAELDMKIEIHLDSRPRRWS